MNERIASGVRLDKVGTNLFSVSDSSGTRGFIEKAGPVYVSLVGTRYDRSVEVAQSLSLENATAVMRPAGPRQ